MLGRWLRNGHEVTRAEVIVSKPKQCLPFDRYFTWKDLTAMSFGCRPVGSMVKSE